MSSSRIAIIALDINAYDSSSAQIDNYFLSPEEEQIKRVEERIRYICNELKTKESDAMWLIAWREYGISDETNRTISSSAKELFKKTMQKLEAEFYPNLAIIAGTIASKKHVIDPSKLKQYQNYYEENSWIKDKEVHPDNHFTQEKEKFNRLLQTPHTGIAILRNTCYIFHDKKIWRHDKITPFKEEKNSALSSSSVHQPGNKKSNNSYCELIHPFTKEKITIGVEICREHGFEILRKNIATKPLIHFIFSASAPIYLDNIHGEYIVHMDSVYRPKMLLTKDENIKSLPIHFYQSNLVAKEHHLSAQLQPLYPFEKNIDNKLNELITYSNGDIKEMAKAFKILFAVKNSNISLHDCLETWLDNNQDTLLNSAINSSSPTLFAAEFSIKKWIEEVRSIMEHDVNKHSLSLDYHSKEHALPLHLSDLFNYYLNKDGYDGALNCLIADNQLINQVQLNLHQARMFLGTIVGLGPERTDKALLCQLIITNIGSEITNSFVENDNQTFLHAACEMNLPFIFNLLLPHFIDRIDCSDKKNNTPLHLAVKNRADLEIIKGLLASGADPDRENNEINNRTPRSLAEATYPEAAQLINSFKTKLAM